MTLIPCGTIFHTTEHLTEPKHILAVWRDNLFCEVLHSHAKLISDIKVWKRRLTIPQCLKAVISMFGASLRNHEGCQRSCKLIDSYKSPTELYRKGERKDVFCTTNPP